MGREPFTYQRGAFIGGRWRDVIDSQPVLTPYDGREVGSIGWCSAGTVSLAIDAAAAAMRRPFRAFERAAVLQRLSDLVAASATDLAELLALEVGKPLRSGRMEVERAVSTLGLCAAEARKLSGHVVPMDATPSGVGKLGFTICVPVGVVAAITPFNFPLNLACHKLGPAIAAGCPVVLKPADKAPLVASLLADLAHDAGLPAGWLNLVVGDPSALAATFADDDRIGLITFTGSSEIGWGLRARAPRKPVTLELGNVTPLIVDETAVVESLAARIAGSAFGFAGQSCVSTQRIYAHELVAARLEAALADAALALTLGDPLSDATDVGPLITSDAVERVQGVIADAMSGGARLVTGGTRDRQVLAPTVLAEAPDGCALLTQEVFGPVVTVQRYTDLRVALAACNATQFGLQAGIFTNRMDHAMAAVRALDFAGVTVNEVPSFRADQMPYGGIGESGNTREGPAYAVRDMTNERLVLLQS